MVRTNLVVASVLTLLLLFAGCTSGRAAEAPVVSGPQSTVGVDSPEAGRIVGLVTDEEEVPLVGAQAGLMGEKASLTPAVTDASGGFTILGVEPGQYTIFATKLGYDQVVLSIIIEAGQTLPVTVRLHALPSTAPYSKTQHQSGYIQCTVRASPGFPAWVPNPGGGHILAPGWYTGLAACAATCNNSLNPGCVPLFPPDKFNLFWNLNETGMNEALLEMTWQSSQAFGKGLSIVLEAQGHVNDGTPTYASAGGMSPLRAYSNASQVRKVWEADKIDCSTATVEKGCRFGTRIFANANTTNYDAPVAMPEVPIFGPPPKRIDFAWVMDQKLDEYLTFFHNGLVRDPSFTALE